MSIDPLGITPIELRGNPGSPKSTDSNVMGRDEFLKLLVSQLSNQDPLDPLKGQEFAAQLAQFTSVEQLINIDETLAAQGEINSVLAQSMNNGVAAGLIGKSVEAPGNQVNWNGETATATALNFSGPAASVKVEVRDATGLVVRTVDLGARSSGEHEFQWDGLDDSGNRVSDGVYTTNVIAQDKNGEAVATSSTVSGTVSRVTFSPEGVFLWIGRMAVNMNNVQSVGQSD